MFLMLKSTSETFFDKFLKNSHGNTKLTRVWELHYDRNQFEFGISQILHSTLLFLILFLSFKQE
jgi:hypothetical protein